MKENQLELFQKTSPGWQQRVISADNKPAILEVFTSVFVKIISEQRNKEKPHAR